MAKIRVAIVGIGNCASSLVQGVEFYRRAAGHSPIPGVMHPELGGYHIGDKEFVAAFDIAAGKVGCDLAQAIFGAPNNTERFSSVPATGVEVRGPPSVAPDPHRSVRDAPPLSTDIADEQLDPAVQIIGWLTLRAMDLRVQIIERPSAVTMS